MLYRSGQFDRLSPESVNELLAIDFDLIVDLRFATEAARHPSPWPQAWAPRVVTHRGGSSTLPPHLALVERTDLELRHVHAFFDELYRTLPFDAHYRALFQEALVRLANGDGPMLVHCAAGKDRTGMFVGVLLALLGATQDEIIADYLKSSGAPALVAQVPEIIERVERRHGHRPPRAAIEALLDVKPEYLLATFDEVRQRVGSVEAYAALDPAVLHKLKSRFT